MDFSNYWFQSQFDDSCHIGNSLLFRGAQTLTGVAGGSGTASVWVKRAGLSTVQTIMPGIAFDADDQLNGSTAAFRDTSAWMHIVVNANGTFVNNTRVADGSAIGAGTIGTGYDGYLAEFILVDGQALDPTAFGEPNESGIWVPRRYRGAYGANGFRLDFSDIDNIGEDKSPNGRDYTANNFNLAPLNFFSADLFTSGNSPNPDLNSTLKGFEEPGGEAANAFDGREGWTAASLNTQEWIIWRLKTPIRVTTKLQLQLMNPTSDVWVNGTKTSITTAAGGSMVYTDISGALSLPLDITSIAVRGAAGFQATLARVEMDGVTLVDNVGHDQTVDTPCNNYAVINPLYLDASTSSGNLTTNNTSGKPSILGVAGAVSVDGTSTAWNGTEAGWNNTGITNFGQLPSGFDEISTAEMPEPPIPNGNDHFVIHLDPGAAILDAAKGLFSSGLWWIKDRVNENFHQLLTPITDQTDETIYSPHLPNFAGAYTAPAGSSVAWCWNCPETFTPTVGGSNTLVAARRNVEAGFSMVRMTNPGSNPVTTNNTFEHGLNSPPEIIMMPCLEFPGGSKNGASIRVWTPGWGNSIMPLNSDDGLLVPAMMQPTAVDATTVTHTSYTVFGDFMALCWHSVPGYSAIGSYTGNGDVGVWPPVNTPFIYTGFRPAWILVKNNRFGNWEIADSTRDVNNPCDLRLKVSDNQEETNIQMVDFLSNGFKIRSQSNEWNGNGDTITYMAFAENPFGGSNVSPANAR